MGAGNTEQKQNRDWYDAPEVEEMLSTLEMLGFKDALLTDEAVSNLEGTLTGVHLSHPISLTAEIPRPKDDDPLEVQMYIQLDPVQVCESPLYRQLQASAETVNAGLAKFYTEQVNEALRSYQNEPIIPAARLPELEVNVGIALSTKAAIVLKGTDAALVFEKAKLTLCALLGDDHRITQEGTLRQPDYS